MGGEEQSSSVPHQCCMEMDCFSNGSLALRAQLSTTTHLFFVFFSSFSFLTETKVQEDIRRCYGNRRAQIRQYYESTSQFMGKKLQRKEAVEEVEIKVERAAML